MGPTDAEILFVGEGPGEQEDLTGEPFVGPAGKLLDDMLRIIDLGRHNCYIANIVKCRPPHNRDPLGTEQDACIGYLRKQTKLLNPKIIVCLGRIAAMKLIREDFKITRDHGTWEQKGGIWFTAMYHPSALLRDVTKRPDTFRDLKACRQKLPSSARIPILKKNPLSNYGERDFAFFTFPTGASGPCSRAPQFRAHIVKRL